jgi:coenzyme F420 biosynthesis associated uncharacterized protein
MAFQSYAGRALVRSLLFAGALGAGAAAVHITRRYQQSDQKAIDWERVRQIAVGMSGNSPADQDVADDTLAAQYRQWIVQVEPLIGDYLKESLPRPLETIYVFDRAQWIDANISNFRELFEPLEQVYDNLLGKGGARTGPLVGGINQMVLSSQVGLLLGYLSKRVLGQYDMSLLGREPVSSGKLYFVERNLRQTDRKLGIPPDQFRLWICLHEATHAFEFEAHPWLATHFNSQIRLHMESMTQQLRHIRLDSGLLEDVTRRLMSGLSDRGHWLELLMSEEQRQIFRHLQALMSMLEGYSNHVMDHIGVTLMPDYTEIKRRFELRRQRKSPADQLFAKLTGLDLKMEQYTLGERFVNEIVAQRGIAFMNNVWIGIETIPDMAEIRDPAKWIARVDSLASAAPVRETA